MSLADVAYQGRAQRTIRRALLQDRVPHAYVFHGPDGVGKETLAQGLAELLLCATPIESPIAAERRQEVGCEHLRAGCGECPDCRAVAARTHPDLHLIYRQLSREHPDSDVRKRKALEISVDVVRHFVIDRVALTPNRGRAKVFIIREADRMTTEAQNALLKTLEEPPGTTFIILLVAALDRLLPTTLSRCQVVPFDALPAVFIWGRLQKMLPALPEDETDWYARSCEGSLGQSMEWANDELFELNRRLLNGMAPWPDSGSAAARRSPGPPPANEDDPAKTWIEESKVLGDRYRKRDPDITDTEAQRRGLKTVFRLAATWYADALRLSTGDDTAIVNIAYREPLAHLAGPLDLRSIWEAINRIALAERHLDLNVNTAICVEALLSDLVRLGRRRRTGLVGEMQQ